MSAGLILQTDSAVISSSLPRIKKFHPVEQSDESQARSYIGIRTEVALDV
jgi:hypothetical protein